MTNMVPIPVPVEHLYFPFYYYQSDFSIIETLFPSKTAQDLEKWRASWGATRNTCCTRLVYIPQYYTLELRSLIYSLERLK